MTDRDDAGNIRALREERDYAQSALAEMTAKRDSAVEARDRLAATVERVRALGRSPRRLGPGQAFLPCVLADDLDLVLADVKDLAP